MKKLIPGLFTLAAFTFTTGNVAAQAFNTEHDTVYVNYTGGIASAFNNITAVNTTKIYWKETANNFPASWQTGNGINICDNKQCYSNIGNAILNATNETESLPYVGGVQDIFEGTFDLSTATTTGTHYVTFNLRDSANTQNKLVTFMVSKYATSVNNVAKSEEVTLYPNPARDEVNVLFDANAGIKNVAVYNVIGKTMVVYRVSGNSAKLDIDKLSAGIYFLRLSDAKGQVVATKKFTKQ